MHRTPGSIVLATSLLLAAATLGACAREPDTTILGTTEWDRIELVADASEPVLAIEVAEGDNVAAGQVLVQLDARRAEAEVAAADAELARFAALLSEQRNGARTEQVDEARARVAAARSLAANAASELQRARSMRAKGLVSAADLERLQAAANNSASQVNAVNASLELLLHGTRPEQIEQTEAAQRSASARRDTAALTLERHTLRAPRAARVDAIAVEVGDQPLRGATVVTLLAGEAPYVRAYIPERLRAQLAPGARFRVTVQGMEQPFAARLRWVRSEPSFTPYYALSGDDASRLTYLAELALEGEAARKLPAGLPVQVEPAAAP